MPGIAAIIGRSSPGEGEALARTMVASMKHASSDVSGTCFAPDLDVYAGWVAHEGSFAARQSATRAWRGMSILVAGEWFANDGNAGVSAPQAPPAGTMLLERYAAKGTSVVAGLNGLFAAILIDPERRCATIFNDRYGSERLYVHEHRGRVFVASEAKALLAVLPDTRAFDDHGVAQFLEYGSTYDGRTLFRGVELLPGGSLWTFDRGGRTRRSYFLPAEWEYLPQLSDVAFTDALNDAMTGVVPRYAAAGARLGISLTGGLDTRMLMACLPGLATAPICYTYAGLTEDTLDVRLAAEVARQCGFEHRTLRIGPDFLSTYGDYVDRTVFVTDGCAGALGAHELYFTTLAERLAPIRLTGNYGSEVLRSMSTFKSVALAPGLLDHDIGALSPHPPNWLAGDPPHPVTRAAFHEIPLHLFGTLAAARSELTFRTPYLDNDIVRLAFQAPPQARRSPGSSLVVVHRNNVKLAAIPTDRGLVWGKRGPVAFARRLFCAVTFKADYWHSEGLPASLAPLDHVFAILSKSRLLGLHKFLPYRTWFARELAPYVRAVLSDPQTASMGYFNRSTLMSLADAHATGQRNHVPEIHAVLTLEAVARTLLRGFDVAADRLPLPAADVSAASAKASTMQAANGNDAPLEAQPGMVRTAGGTQPATQQL